MSMKSKWLVGFAALAVLVGGSCSDDDESTDEATSDTVAETTAAPETSAAPTPDTAEPALGDLDPAQLVAVDQAREDHLVSCAAGTAETDEETCVLIWNCAVNQVGVATAADPAQAATLDQALADCTTSLG